MFVASLRNIFSSIDSVPLHTYMKALALATMSSFFCIVAL